MSEPEDASHALATARVCLIAAPGSGQGKTWVTAALARHCVRQGRTVRVLKVGPDFIDPAILARASRAEVYSFDPWMADERSCRQQLHVAAREADVVLIEGAMGLFDGTPSCADLALRFDLPVLLVIDASAMAQTFGALLHGMSSYRDGLRVLGALANRVGGPGHARLLSASLRDPRHWYGALERDESSQLPERHLGLVMPAEIPDLEARLDRAADAVRGFELERLPLQSWAAQPLTSFARDLQGVRVAVAKDAAFCFVYPENLELLRRLGAQLSFFSPCTDVALPAADALYLPGGYPELHAAELQANTAMRAAIAAHVDQGKPALAECGGLMYLARSLRSVEGKAYAMAGVLECEVEMQPRLVSIGHYSGTLQEGALRGHAFHHSRLHTQLQASELASSAHGGPDEPVLRKRRLVASYVHWYFPSNPQAVIELFRLTA